MSSSLPRPSSPSLFLSPPVSPSRLKQIKILRAGWLQDGTWPSRVVVDPSTGERTRKGVDVGGGDGFLD
jgi:hypothetical protein